MTIRAKFGITVGRYRRTTLDMLQSGKDPLLLTLDEAQILGRKNLIPLKKNHIVDSVLNAIHNGNLGRPVILIAGGLGTTEDAFGSLGISRFANGCFVELGALDKEAECAVLHDWLTKDGGAKGDTTAWIDAITQETHGWPQHILTYVEPAIDQLHADKSVMTTEGLNTVLEAGREGLDAYYKQRTDSFRRDEIRYLTRSLAGESVEYRDIVSSLTKEYGDSEAKQLFRRFLEKGVLAKC